MYAKSSIGIAKDGSRLTQGGISSTLCNNEATTDAEAKLEILMLLMIEVLLLEVQNPIEFGSFDCLMGPSLTISHAFSLSIQTLN